MISPLFVEDALGCLHAQGIAVAPLLTAAGLPGRVTEPVSAEQFGRLWLAMADALDDEFFGLGARPMRPGSFALMGHAVLHAGTLDKALRRALRFLRVVLDDPHGELVVTGGAARIVLTDAGAPRSAFAYRTFWLILHGLACWLVGRRIPLRQVDFACAPPEHRADYRLFFGAPVRFRQGQSQLCFDAAYLSLPTIRSEQALKQFLRGAPANLLVRYRHDAGLAARLRAELRQTPPADWPGFAGLARQLHLSPVTLRRRLRAEGQSFGLIRDELRHVAAQELLRDPGLTPWTRSQCSVASPRSRRGWASANPAPFTAPFANGRAKAPARFGAGAMHEAPFQGRSRQ